MLEIAVNTTIEFQVNFMIINTTKISKNIYLV